MVPKSLPSSATSETQSPPDFGPWDAEALQPVPGLPLPCSGPQVPLSHPHVQTLLVFSLDNPLFGPSQCAPLGDSLEGSFLPAALRLLLPAGGHQNPETWHLRTGDWGHARS